MVYSIHGLVGLPLRFSIAIGGAVEPPAAHTFERASLCHLDDAPTVRSSLLDRGAQDVICGPIFSWCFGLQRRGSMPPHGLGMAFSMNTSLVISAADAAQLHLCAAADACKPQIQPCAVFTG